MERGSSVKSMSVTMIQQYVRMVETRMQPLISQAELLASKLKADIESELKIEIGISALDVEIAKLEAAIKHMKDRRAEIMGEEKEATGRYIISRQDSAFDKEVERRLEERDGMLGSLRKEERRVIEQIWLEGAPTRMVELLAELDKKLNEDLLPQLQLIAARVLPEKRLGAPKKLKKGV